MPKKFLFTFFMIYFIFANYAEAIFINEFMPAPLDNCSQCSEWIELKTNEDENLDGIFVDTGETTKTILNGTIKKDEFIIITKNASVFLEIWNITDVKIIESSKMRLTDGGDSIRIYNDSQLIQEIYYIDAKKNISFGFCYDNLTNLCILPIATPGSENICDNNESNATNITCDISIKIEAENIFENYATHDYYLVLNDNCCVDKEVIIEYWLEDLFTKNTTKFETKQKFTCYRKIMRQWTPKIEGSVDAFYIKARLVNFTCEEQNDSDNYAEKLIVVKGEPKPENSKISIVDVDLGSDGKAKFGDLIDIKINVYRGDINKNKIYLWVERADGKNVSKLDFEIFTKFSNYTLTLPMQINPNCDLTFTPGYYKIKVSGLDAYDEKQILIEGNSSMCKTINVKQQQNCICPSIYEKNACKNEENKTNNRNFYIYYSPDEISPDEEFEIKIFVNTSEAKKCVAYSYVYDGNKLFSLGYDDKKWSKTWTANKQEFLLNESSIINLTNKIANETKPGEYKLKVKLICEGKEEELMKEIQVKEYTLKEEILTDGDFNLVENIHKDEENILNFTTEEKIKIPTGKAIEKKENFFLDLINNFINFFKNLIKI